MIAEGHPPTLYLQEESLHATVTGYLATAIFGPSRADYWRAALADADADGTVKADRESKAQRLAEIEATIADLTRRLQRQILNLEDDQLPGVARQQIMNRIGQLEADIATHQAMADQLSDIGGDDPAAQDPDEIATALSRLPELADELKDMPEAALRDLYESLGLTITYVHSERAIDIQITLADPPSGDTESGAQTSTPPEHNRAGSTTQTCSVPPVGFEPTLSEV